MGLKEVQEYFAKKGIDNEIILLDADTSTVDLAAKALGKQPGEIAKSLTFLLKDGTPILILCMGTARIDNHKFKETFSCKATMIPREETENLIGHAAGGVCPFGVKEGVKIFLDESLKKYTVVYPAAGTSNSAVAFTIKELEMATDGSWVNVCKDEE